MQYDPFPRGPFPVGVRTTEARDEARERVFPIEIWYPAAERHAGQDLAPDTQDRFRFPGREGERRQLAVRDAEAAAGDYPLIVFSHSSGSDRRGVSYLCTHLASHGYRVAALDHSERIAPELAPKPNETEEQRAARADAWISSRVPDLLFLMNQLLEGAGGESTRVGAVGHSLGGWTVLAATDLDPRIAAVVAFAPGGNSRPKPGILNLKLSFDRDRDVPTLYLAAENDAMTPPDGIRELLNRTPGTKKMVILRRADHLHFVDHVEEEHEFVRAMPFSGKLAWIPQEMRPAAELCSGEQANLFVRGLTLAHMDAFLRGCEEARQFLDADLEAELAARVSAQLRRRRDGGIVVG